MPLYLPIKSRSDFAEVLGLGYASAQRPHPWIRFDEMMDKYGDQSCIDITPPNKFVRYAPRYWYIERGYNQGTLEDLRATLGRT